MRRADTGDGSSRRCVVTGAVRPIEEMVRFVESPGGEVVPDLERILPGRGIWLSASRDVLNTAVAKGLFSKAARKRLTAPPDLADRVERLLAKRCFDLLGLARRAGQVAAGSSRCDRKRGPVVVPYCWRRTTRRSRAAPRLAPWPRVCRWSIFFQPRAGRRAGPGCDHACAGRTWQACRAVVDRNTASGRFSAGRVTAGTRVR